MFLWFFVWFVAFVAVGFSFGVFVFWVSIGCDLVSLIVWLVRLLVFNLGFGCSVYVAFALCFRVGCLVDCVDWFWRVFELVLCFRVCWLLAEDCLLDCWFGLYLFVLGLVFECWVGWFVNMYLLILFGLIMFCRLGCIFGCLFGFGWFMFVTWLAGLMFVLINSVVWFFFSFFVCFIYCLWFVCLLVVCFLFWIVLVTVGVLLLYCLNTCGCVGLLLMVWLWFMIYVCLFVFSVQLCLLVLTLDFVCVDFGLVSCFGCCVV